MGQTVEVITLGPQGKQEATEWGDFRPLGMSFRKRAQVVMRRMAFWGRTRLEAVAMIKDTSEDGGLSLSR